MQEEIKFNEGKIAATKYEIIMTEGRKYEWKGKR